MNNILVTGGAGFIGSNFINLVLSKDNEKTTNIVNIDKLTYAGNLENLKDVSNHTNYKFIEGDINNQKLLNELFLENEFNYVFHFAAESHVDNSISSPEVFVKTNVNGTFTLLEEAKKHWMKKPFEYKSGCEGNKFIHVSTDEVYGSLGQTGKFSETSPYKPNSPYSASKAASDLFVRSYFKTYGLNTIITNCSNNFGERQHSEKLIPTIIRNALNGEKIPIYGNGKNIRDWLYVRDHCEALIQVMENGKNGETYNIGGDNEIENIEIANLICTLLDELKPSSESYKNQIQFVDDRPGHDWRYAVDSSKIKKELGWKPSDNFRSNIENTINWYTNSFNGNP